MNHWIVQKDVCYFITITWFWFYVDNRTSKIRICATTAESILTQTKSHTVLLTQCWCPNSLHDCACNENEKGKNVVKKNTTEEGKALKRCKYAWTLIFCQRFQCHGMCIKSYEYHTLIRIITMKKLILLSQGETAGHFFHFFFLILIHIQLLYIYYIVDCFNYYIELWHYFLFEWQKWHYVEK